MPLLTQVPKHFEIWAGGPNGLRLRQHPRIDEALVHLNEYPMILRLATPIESIHATPIDKLRVHLSSLPAFRRSSVGETVELLLELDCPPIQVQGPIQFARIFVQSHDTLLEEHVLIKPGMRQSMTFPFPAFDRRTELTVWVELRDQGEAGRVRTSFVLEPQKRLTFYYAFQTHLDLGWTDRVARTVASLEKMTSEVAIDVCRKYMDRPEGEKFVWTCECSDALRMAWRGANAGQREVLREFIRKQLIQCCSFPFSFHTGLMSRDLLRRSLDRSEALRREIGVEELDLSVAQSNDVPGHSWIVPDLLAEKGIKRAMIGHNAMVRGCRLPPLFYWKGPAGGKVLTLATSNADYGAEFPIPRTPADLWNLSTNNPQSRQMPGTAIIRTIGYGENCGPEGAEREINSITAWNQQFAWPRLVIAGPKDYFNHIEPEIDPATLPVIDKEISDWWIDGPASTPKAMAQFRLAMIDLARLENQVPKSHEQHRSLLARAEEQLILHSEHTFGLNAQLVRPIASAQGWALGGMDEYLGSWEDKEKYADEATRCLAELKQSYPVQKSSVLATRGQWKIDWDAAGISKLIDETGHCWYDRAALRGAPAFAALTQTLLAKEQGEWFHHNPSDAPNAGDYPFTLESISAYSDGQSSGVAMKGRLDSPAGAIPSIRIRIGNALSSPDLFIDIQLAGKIATAQSEYLTLALPFGARSPVFRTDVGGTMLTVDEDQVPDSNRDEHPVIAGWTLTDPEADATLAVSSAEAFLWHFGDRRYCLWNHSPKSRSATGYAHLLNNVWNTNFRCWIGGDLRYTLRIRRADLNALSQLQAMSELW